MRSTLASSDSRLTVKSPKENQPNGQGPEGGDLRGRVPCSDSAMRAHSSVFTSMSRACPLLVPQDTGGGQDNVRSQGEAEVLNIPTIFVKSIHEWQRNRLLEFCKSRYRWLILNHRTTAGTIRTLLVEIEEEATRITTSLIQEEA
jgi:hypothetical protein